MNLLELAKTAKRILHIEIRPSGEYIVSFGEECTLITERFDRSAHRVKTPSVHGRGKSVNEAAKNLVAQMSSQERRYFLRFPPSFDNQMAEFQVEGLMHEENLIK